ncbi:hypothetical protein GCM10009560_32330 [Nonomuraea longicatena]|uniref:Uncharacterized protein n=1 Tax=Nonomuraea longicatena TaxID=83682 RepID=A0ABN1PIW6_9ACTN
MSCPPTLGTRTAPQKIHFPPEATDHFPTSAARRSPAQPGAARRSPAQPGAARRSPAQPGAKGTVSFVAGSAWV